LKTPSTDRHLNSLLLTIPIYTPMKTLTMNMQISVSFDINHYLSESNK